MVSCPEGQAGGKFNDWNVVVGAFLEGHLRIVGSRTGQKSLPSSPKLVSSIGRKLALNQQKNLSPQLLSDCV